MSTRVCTIQILADVEGALHITANGGLTLQEVLLAVEMIRDDLVAKSRRTGGFDLGQVLQPKRMP